MDAIDPGNGTDGDVAAWDFKHGRAADNGDPIVTVNWSQRVFVLRTTNVMIPEDSD